MDAKFITYCQNNQAEYTQLAKEADADHCYMEADTYVKLALIYNKAQVCENCVYPTVDHLYGWLMELRDEKMGTTDVWIVQECIDDVIFRCDYKYFDWNQYTPGNILRG